MRLAVAVKEIPSAPITALGELVMFCRHKTKTIECRFTVQFVTKRVAAAVAHEGPVVTTRHVFFT
jgi:hypothetical protein